MTLNEIKNDVIGVWTGENLLRLSWQTPSDFHSRGELTATAAIKDKFLSVSYQWSHEDTSHEGLILLGFDAPTETVNAAWIDSWHSNNKPLVLSGTISEAKVIDLRGNYEVPNHPDWGWRIVITPAENDLKLTMYNISPESVEDLAVRADYKRVLQ